MDQVLHSCPGDGDAAERVAQALNQISAIPFVSGTSPHLRCLPRLLPLAGRLFPSLPPSAQLPCFRHNNPCEPRISSSVSNVKPYISSSITLTPPRTKMPKGSSGCLAPPPPPLPLLIVGNRHVLMQSSALLLPSISLRSQDCAFAGCAITPCAGRRARPCRCLVPAHAGSSRDLLVTSWQSSLATAEKAGFRMAGGSSLE